MAILRDLNSGDFKGISKVANLRTRKSSNFSVSKK